MKKILSLILALTMVSALAACGNSSAGEREPSEIPSQTEGFAVPEESEITVPTENTTQPEESTQPEEASEPEAVAGSTSLIVYFSWSGNTESVANEIQAQTGADVFEIIPEEAYTDDYDTLLDIAQEEQRNDARPVIAGNVENFDQYEVIYFGFPNWWGDMPMILYTFLDEYDFSGKTIAPFVTSGGSGFSNTISTIESMEPDATVVDGLSLGSSAAANPGSDVTQWLSSLGLSE